MNEVQSHLISCGIERSMLYDSKNQLQNFINELSTPWIVLHKCNKTFYYKIQQNRWNFNKLTFLRILRNTASLLLENTFTQGFYIGKAKDNQNTCADRHLICYTITQFNLLHLHAPIPYSPGNQLAETCENLHLQ